ncbi:MAG: type II secretion system protein [Chloroflexi bacterium]|nr:type II secretion system protein [Chloroflexota bacterium]
MNAYSRPNCAFLSGTCRRGFTLVEIMIVVAIIGVLAVMAIPSFMKSRRTARVNAVANDLRVFGDALNMYAMEHGGFPDDAHISPPFPAGSGVDEYIKVSKWSATTPLGGNYNWEGPDSYPYAGIAIFGSTAPADRWVELDELIDDGDIITGSFRQTPNGRYTYVIEE